MMIKLMLRFACEQAMSLIRISRMGIDHHGHAQQVRQHDEAGKTKDSAAMKRVAHG